MFQNFKDTNVPSVIISVFYQNIQLALYLVFGLLIGTLSGLPILCTGMLLHVLSIAPASEKFYSSK